MKYSCCNKSFDISSFVYTCQYCNSHYVLQIENNNADWVYQKINAAKQLIDLIGIPKYTNPRIIMAKDIYMGHVAFENDRFIKQGSLVLSDDPSKYSKYSNVNLFPIVKEISKHRKAFPNKPVNYCYIGYDNHVFITSESTCKIRRGIVGYYKGSIANNHTIIKPEVFLKTEDYEICNDNESALSNERYIGYYGNYLTCKHYFLSRLASGSRIIFKRDSTLYIDQSESHEVGFCDKLYSSENTDVEIDHDWFKQVVSTECIGEHTSEDYKWYDEKFYQIWHRNYYKKYKITYADGFVEIEDKLIKQVYLDGPNGKEVNEPTLYS